MTRKVPKKLLPLLLLTALPAQAAVFRVTTTADTLRGVCYPHDCSLREAVQAANAHPGKDFLILGPGVYTLERPGAGDDLGTVGDLDVHGDLVVLGAGADRTVIDAAGLDRAFDADFSLELRDLAVRNGHAEHGGGIQAESLVLAGCLVTGNRADGFGGGIEAARLDARDCTVSGNEAVQGGGISAWDSLVLESSTVSNNRAQRGGGLFLGALENTLRQVSITGNRADRGGGVSFDDSSNCTGVCSEVYVLTRSVIAGNQAAESPDCDAVPGDSGGFNLFGVGGGCRPVATDRAGTAAHPLPPEPLPGCTPSAEALCLGNRFQVTVRGAGEVAHANRFAADTGAFWFFAPDNLELMVKVLDGCALNQRFWVFLSGLTDVKVDVTVVDSVTGGRWEHHHAGGSALPTRLDTNALAGCSAAGPGTPLPSPAGSVFRVTTTADTLGVCDRDCSLREAVSAANLRPGTDAILLPPGVYTLTREGRGEDMAATGDLDVEDDLVILGAGAAETAVDGGGIDRVFHVTGEGSLELHGTTVRNGWAQAGSGGGILAGGPLRVERSAVSGNRSDVDGGGIAAGELTLVDSTLSGNRAGTYGGGLWDGHFLLLTNSTLSGNEARYGGGAYLLAGDAQIDQATITANTGLNAYGGLAVEPPACLANQTCQPTRLALSRSIVAGNSAALYPDCGALSDNLGGNNLFGSADQCFAGITDLVGVDPRLSPLRDHGGPTPTHLPLAGSPAIDLADLTCFLATDQRGARRRSEDPYCDTGAVEVGWSCIPGPTRLCLQGGRFEVTVEWVAQGHSGPGRTVPLTADSGAFWFFDPANLEMTVKVLEGCSLNSRFWVFVSGLTDVGVQVFVKDTHTGNTWHLDHAGGTPLQPTLDTDALQCVQL